MHPTTLRFKCNYTKHAYALPFEVSRLRFWTSLCLWLFSYERLSGILGNQPSNNRSIEIQLMRRFNRNNAAYGISPPEEFCDELSDELSSLNLRVTGSLFITQNPDLSYNEQCEYSLPKSFTCRILSRDDVYILTQVLIKLLSLSSVC